MLTFHIVFLCIVPSRESINGAYKQLTLNRYPATLGLNQAIGFQAYVEEGKDLQDIGPYNWRIGISRTVPETYQFSQVALIPFAFLISEELLWNFNFSCNSPSALNRPTWLQIWLPRQWFSSPFHQLLGPLWNWNYCLGRVQHLVCGIRIVDLSQSVIRLGILGRFVQHSFRKCRLGFKIHW